MPAALGLVAVALGAAFFLRVNFAHRYTSMARAIVTLDRHSGEVLWIARALEGPPPAIDGRNSPATPTPVTDGRLVCAYFGTAGLMCATAQGRIAWTRTDLAYDGAYGVGFSPLLADDLLIVASDQPNGVAVIDALDVRTGRSVWTRRFATTPTWTGNSRTPLVHEVRGIKVLILWGMEYVKAVALTSGETMWEFPYTSGGDMVASAVADDDRLYLAAVGGTVALGHADLAAGRNPVRWANKARANCASPVLANGLLFTVSDAGVAAAVDASSGEIAWRQRLPGQYFASLVASPTAVYFTNNEGLTTVVAAERTFQILGQNHLPEETVASMATAGCALFIRSAGYLYAIQGP
jgi:outer membrane protein assembly factor BamB